MTANDLAVKIANEMVHWTMSPADRAQAVLDWCRLNSVDISSIRATPLAVAMSKQPYWLQQPSNYLDMVRSIAAFLAAR